MGEIMNSPKGVKSGVPERVSQICEQGLYDDHRISE